MFEHLPVITEASLRVMRERELPEFEGLLRLCVDRSDNLDQAIDYVCEDFKSSNPFLVKAVRACAYAVGKTFEGEIEPAGVEWQAAMCAVAGLLAALRLIDRALEARELEQGLGT